MATYESQPTSVDLDQYETVRRYTSRTKFRSRTSPLVNRKARPQPALIVCATSLRAIEADDFGPVMPQAPSCDLFTNGQHGVIKSCQAKGKKPCPMMM